MIEPTSVLKNLLASRLTFADLTGDIWKAKRDLPLSYI